jgi:hypothetical protein
MSKLEELHFAAILETDYDPEDKVPNYVGFASKSAQLTKDLMIEFVDSLRNYEKESHNLLGFDERETEELLEIFLKQRNGE